MIIIVILYLSNIYRLNTTNNIKDIVTSSIVNQHTCIISLQFCPLKRTLYACVGYPKLTLPNQQRSDFASSEELPGSWSVNKVR